MRAPCKALRAHPPAGGASTAPLLRAICRLGQHDAHVTAVQWCQHGLCAAIAAGFQAQAAQFNQNLPAMTPARFLVGIDVGGTFLGRRSSLPVAIAPMAAQEAGNAADFSQRIRTGLAGS